MRVCMYRWVMCACMPSMKVRGGHCIPWTWSYRWPWVTMWVLGTEPRSSAGEASAPVCWAISPDLSCIIFDTGIPCYISFREGWIYICIYSSVCSLTSQGIWGRWKWLWVFSRKHSYQTGRCFTRAPYLHIYTSISLGSVYRRTEAIFKYPMMLLSFSVIGYSFCSG